MEIGIIADDLTGAADAIALFAQRGYGASVGFKNEQRHEPFPLLEGDALAVDTATRDMAGSQERAIALTMRQVARRLAEWEPRIVFKKIDSTLRGHLRLELEAVRAEFPNRLAIVCPAFPAQGRTVQGSVLHIHNLPWTATEFARGGSAGILTVRGAFGMEGDAGAKQITSGDIRQGVDGLEAQLQKYRAQGVEAVFCDAVVAGDLDILAQTIMRQPYSYLPVGSAGLARAIAANLPLHGSPAPAPQTLVEPFHTGRVLVVVGSLHTASRRQSLFLSERLQMNPVVVDHAGNVRQNVERAVNEVCGRYADGQRVVVLTTPDTPEANNREDFARMPGWGAWGVCMRQRQAGQPVNALVICGGNTALELCQSFGGVGLRITGEWEPGIALGSLLVEPEDRNNLCFDGLPIVTKAGGFGDAVTLARLVGLP